MIFVLISCRKLVIYKAQITILMPEVRKNADNRVHTDEYHINKLVFQYKTARKEFFPLQFVLYVTLKS